MGRIDKRFKSFVFHANDNILYLTAYFLLIFSMIN